MDSVGRDLEGLAGAKGPRRLAVEREGNLALQNVADLRPHGFFPAHRRIRRKFRDPHAELTVGLRHFDALQNHGWPGFERSAP